MGVAKAALEASVRYLAADLGPDGIRVNAISAGPVRTLAAAGIGGFKKMYGEFADIAPLRANITIEDVGRTAVYLASDLSSAVTGEVIYVDGGFSVLGVPTGDRRRSSPGARASCGRCVARVKSFAIARVVDLRRGPRTGSPSSPRRPSSIGRSRCAWDAIHEDRLELAPSCRSAPALVGDRRVGQRDQDVAAGEDHADPAPQVDRSRPAGMWSEPETT